MLVCIHIHSKLGGGKTGEGWEPGRLKFASKPPHLLPSLRVTWAKPLKCTLSAVSLALGSRVQWVWQ